MQNERFPEHTDWPGLARLLMEISLHMLSIIFLTVSFSYLFASTQKGYWCARFETCEFSGSMLPVVLLLLFLLTPIYYTIANILVQIKVSRLLLALFPVEVLLLIFAITALFGSYSLLGDSTSVEIRSSLFSLPEKCQVSDIQSFSIRKSTDSDGIETNVYKFQLEDGRQLGIDEFLLDAVTNKVNIPQVTDPQLNN